VFASASAACAIAAWGAAAKNKEIARVDTLHKVDFIIQIQVKGAPDSAQT
jgi:hypothetical protein